MQLTTGNLLTDLPEVLNSESFETLVDHPAATVERIVSHDHQDDPEHWYDQPQDEWVMLLQGSATLVFAKPNEHIELQPGDWVLIPAHRRHRVARTAKNGPSVWLALHLPRAGSGRP